MPLRLIQSTCKEETSRDFIPKLVYAKSRPSVVDFKARRSVELTLSLSQKGYNAPMSPITLIGNGLNPA